VQPPSEDLGPGEDAVEGKLGLRHEPTIDLGTQGIVGGIDAGQTVQPSTPVCVRWIRAPDDDAPQQAVESIQSHDALRVIPGFKVSGLIQNRRKEFGAVGPGDEK
jgi:hypothetical protein